MDLERRAYRLLGSTFAVYPPSLDHDLGLAAVLLNSYTTDIYIKEQIKRNWRQAVDALVLEALSDHRELRARISAEFERKLRLQLTAAIKEAGKDVPNNSN